MSYKANGHSTMADKVLTVEDWLARRGWLTTGVSLEQTDQRVCRLCFGREIGALETGSRVDMNLPVVLSSASSVALVLALGVFLWRAFARMLADLNARFDRMDDRFDRMDDRFDRMDDRFDSMDRQFDERFAVVDERFDQVNGRLVGIEGRVDTLEGRFDTLEGKVDALAKDHQSLARELAEFRGEMRGRLDALVPTPR